MSHLIHRLVLLVFCSLIEMYILLHNIQAPRVRAEAMRKPGDWIKFSSELRCLCRRQHCGRGGETGQTNKEAVRHELTGGTCSLLWAALANTAKKLQAPSEA